jgi:hypothetical protein
MSIVQLKSRYSEAKVAGKRNAKVCKFNPTLKYIEHSLALVEAKAILHDRELNFTDKYSILAIIKVIERKLDFHYKHKDFNLAIATAEFKRARKLLKI